MKGPALGELIQRSFAGAVHGNIARRVGAYRSKRRRNIHNFARIRFDLMKSSNRQRNGDGDGDGDGDDDGDGDGDDDYQKW